MIPDFRVKVKRFNVNSNNNDFEIVFENELGEEFGINQPSSGEKTLLGSIFSLYFEEVKDLIILIDEPEDSLHPSWQSKVPQLYENYAKQNKLPNYNGNPLTLHSFRR